MSELKELMLREPRLTLGVAESVTCGRLQARIGAIPGASHFFIGGLTAYTLEEKVRHLGVDRTTAEKTNCVAREVAEQMARGACTFFNCDLALATTGYAEPSVEWNVPQPFAWWALAYRRRPDGEPAQSSGGAFDVLATCIDGPGLDRVPAQERIAEAAVMGLIKFLRAVRGV